MSVIRIKKGYDIPIPGRAEEVLVEGKAVDRVAVKPPDVRGFVPRLKVELGDRVSIGTPVVENKVDERMVLASPGAGQVVAINRGPRRRLEEIVIELDGEGGDSESSVEFRANNSEGIGAGLPREEILERLLEAGLWPLLVQRPYAKIANPEDNPQAIFVNAMETEPLKANPAFLLQGQEDSFQAGLQVLNRLTDGTVHLCCAEETSPRVPFLTETVIPRVHSFEGPHPSGCVGTHIQEVEPLRRGNVHWTLKATDVALIGRLFLTGRFPHERVIAVAGEGAFERKYVKSRFGAPVQSLLVGGAREGKNRFLSGGVLTGAQVDGEGFLGFYDSTLTVIPEGGKRTLFGWMLPGFKKSSFSRTFASTLTGGDDLPFDTSLNGDPRAIVPIGSYESVMALDIQPTFLVKSILYGDVEEAEKLGLLECAEEDVALCSYVCHSKTDFGAILRRGLDQYEKES